MDPRERSTILIHYYRAMIGRADVWRMRMDATTNWAIGATAAVISFVLGEATTPHYIVFIAVLLTVSFLLLEARRLCFYHLWQQRAQLIETSLIARALGNETPDQTGDDTTIRETIGARTGTPPNSTAALTDAALAEALAPHLGRTIPNMSHRKAVARRLRRIYLYLFAVQLSAWIFKLATTPSRATSLSEIVERAHTGAIPGEVVIVLVGLGSVTAIAIAALRGGVGGESPRSLE